MIVECKRPRSDASIPGAIADARHQLAKRYREVRRSNITGFIALDLTKASNPNLAVTSYTCRREVVSLISQRMESVNTMCTNSWNWVREEQTAGVLLRLSTLAWVKEDRSMSWVYKTGITPIVGRSETRVGVVRAVQHAVNRAVMSGANPWTAPR